MRGSFSLAYVTSKSLLPMLVGAYREEVQWRRGVASVDLDDKVLLALQAVAELLTGESRETGLLLMGDVGRGKTTILKAIRQVLLNMTSLSKEYDLIISATQIAKACADVERIDNLSRRPLLIVDDIGTEPSEVQHYGTTYTPMSEILEARYNELSTTILTTNASKEELEEYYGKRIFDRMREQYRLIVFRGESYRGMKIEN